jgi:hypothetical protein
VVDLDRQMAERPSRPRILIPGGYGVFGQRLAEEVLAHTGATVVLAGRDPARAGAARRALEAAAGGAGSDRAEAVEAVEAVRLDLTEPGTLARAAAGCFAVACAAGPFQSLPRGLPGEAVGAGAHWLDLADYRAWVRPLLDDRALDRAAGAAGVAVVPGLSTIPALSGALAGWARRRLPEAIRGRVVLAIGNRNPKGVAAVASALGAGLTAPRPVALPVGRRIAYRFGSAEAALLAEDLGLDLALFVAFEPLPALVMGAAGRLGARLEPPARLRLASWLARLARPFSRAGSPVSCLQVELEDGAGRGYGAALVASGQRLAVLPCALAIEALLAGELGARGLVHPVTWLPPEAWLARLRARGVRLVVTPPRADNR